MITAQQFFDKWRGKPINWDGYYGQQCVDVYNQYNVDVVGCRNILVAGAKDIWNNYPTEAYTRIANTPSGVPGKGSVMIWGTSVGAYGHVAVVIDANVNSFTSLDQNWPFDNGTGVAHNQWHNYNGVLGWLAPKKDVNFDQAAYEAELRRQAEAAAAAAAAAKAEADRIAKLAEEQAKAEADAKAKAEAEAARKEAERIALEQAQKDADAAAQKAAADKAALEKETMVNGLVKLFQNIWDWIKSIFKKWKE